MATEVITAPEGRIIHKTYAVLSGSAMPQRVHVTQYDESLPVIACTLYKDGQLYTIPDGASVRLRMNKNGLPVYHEAMGIDDARHVVYLEITTQMTVLYGEFAMVIEVETSDGKTAGTSYLRLIVRQNPVQNPELDNIPDYTANSNKLTAEGVKKLQDESSTQQKAIEDKGKNTLESIPADYSTLSGKVNENTSGISELKEDLTQLGDGNDKYVSLAYEAGWIDTNGNLVSYDDRWRTIDYYPITENMTMQKVNSSAVAYIDYFDSDKKLKTFAQFNDTEVRPISTNYAYFKLVVRNVENITKASNSVKITEQYPLVGLVRALEDLPTKLLSYANLNPKKILTWIDDDTVNIDSINRVKSICESVGVRCTFATITGNWTDDIVQALKNAQDDGYHVTTHGHSSHTFWRTEAENLLDGDLAKSIRLLSENGFVDSDMFVYAGSTIDRTDVDIKKIAKKWCRCGIKDYVSGGGKYWTKYGQGRYLINRRFFDKSVNADVSYYTNQLDVFSVSDNPWFVFGSHSNQSDQFDSDLVTEVLQYAVNNGWEVMTLNEALRYRMKFYEIKDLFNL